MVHNARSNNDAAKQAKLDAKHAREVKRAEMPLLQIYPMYHQQVRQMWLHQLRAGPGATLGLIKARSIALLTTLSFTRDV